MKDFPTSYRAPITAREWTKKEQHRGTFPSPESRVACCDVHADNMGDSSHSQGKFVAGRKGLSNLET